MVERELPKLLMRVRFPLPAPYKNPSLTEGFLYGEIGRVQRNPKGQDGRKYQAVEVKFALRGRKKS